MVEPGPPRPLVSTIIRTRNRATLLPRAVDSVLAQEGAGSAFDIEVVVVDDASSDATPEIVTRYPDVRYIRLEQQRGPTVAANVGLQAGTGKYVAFQDDDDEWLPHKLRVQVEALERHPNVGVVYSQSVVRTGQHEFLWPERSAAPSGAVFRALLRTCFCAHPPMLLVRRAVFDAVGSFDERLWTNEDYDLWLRAAFHFPFLFVPGAVAVYNQSATGSYYSTMARRAAAVDARAAIEKALRLLPEGRREDALRHEARLGVELKIAQHEVWYAERETRWRALLAVVRAHPDILGYGWGRGAVAMEGADQIVGADNPVARGRSLEADLREAASAPALRRWLTLRLTLAALWAQGAEALSRLRRGNRRAAAWAALRAAAYDPSKLRKRRLIACLAGGIPAGWGGGTGAAKREL